MSSNAIIIPDQAALQQVADNWPAQAKAFQITDKTTLAQAGMYLSAIAALLKEADDTFDTPIRAAHAAHKAAIKARDGVKAPLLDADRTFRAKMRAYQQAEEAAWRRQEQARLEAEAKAAEQKRLDELALQKAIELEAQGKAAEAEAALMTEEVTAESIGPVEVTAQAPVLRVPGASFRAVWKAVITDGRQLFDFVAADQGPLAIQLRQAALDGMTPLLNKWARETHSIGVPGVKAVKDTTVSVR